MKSILWLPVMFTSCSLGLYYISSQLPPLPATGLTVNSSALKFPSNLEELQSLAVLLEHYRTNHVCYILLLYSSAYLFKQTFAIPGSVFMNLLAGALFGQWVGFLLTCILSASGATACFLVANVCGRSYIQKYFPAQLKKVHDKIEENSDSLFFFLMFLRLFPMTPNWFLNISSPICGVPIHLFFLSVFFGLMPYNFICVQTGCLLSTLTSLDDIFSMWTMLKLFSMATVALVPGLLIKKYQQHRSNQKHEKAYQERVARLQAEIEQLEALERKVTDMENNDRKDEQTELPTKDVEDHVSNNEQTDLPIEDVEDQVTNNEQTETDLPTKEVEDQVTDNEQTDLPTEDVEDHVKDNEQIDLPTKDVEDDVTNNEQTDLPSKDMEDQVTNNEQIDLPTKDVEDHVKDNEQTHLQTVSAEATVNSDNICAENKTDDRTEGRSESVVVNEGKEDMSDLVLNENVVELNLEDNIKTELDSPTDYDDIKPDTTGVNLKSHSEEDVEEEDIEIIPETGLCENDDEHGVLHQLVLPPPITDAVNAIDGFNYQVTMETDDNTHMVGHGYNGIQDSTFTSTHNNAQLAKPHTNNHSAENSSDDLEILQNSDDGLDGAEEFTEKTGETIGNVENTEEEKQERIEAFVKDLIQKVVKAALEQVKVQLEDRAETQTNTEMNDDRLESDLEASRTEPDFPSST